jgi:hypothetical protein
MVQLVKIIFLILVLNFGYAFAAAGGGGSKTDDYPRDPVIGNPGKKGVVFATKRDAEEALKRGAYDDRNPFVECVGCLVFKWTKDSPTVGGTLVRIADDVFLTAGHLLDDLRKRMAAGGEIDCRIYMGEERLPMKKFFFITAVDNDIGLILTEGCAAHAKPRAGYPKLAPSALDLSKPRDGYVVSQTTLKFIGPDGKPKDLEDSRRIHRTISIIPNLLKTEKGGITSLTTMGESWVEGEELPSALRDILAISKGKKTVDAVYEDTVPKIKRLFPGTREKSNQRLHAHYGEGASGSALFLKEKGEFVLAGIYTSVHLDPCLKGALSLIPNVFSDYFPPEARLNISFLREFVKVIDKHWEFINSKREEFEKANSEKKE